MREGYYEIPLTRVGDDEYLVLHFITTAIGVEKALTPTAPVSGRGWRLINVIIAGTSVFQYWRRRVAKQGAPRVHYCSTRDPHDKHNAECRVFSKEKLDAIEQAGRLTHERKKVTCKACRKSRVFVEVEHRRKRGAR